LITALVLSFAGDWPPGLGTGTATSQAQVTVTDTASNAPITTAAVKINGVALSYSSSVQYYSGQLTVHPGDTVSVSVTVGSTVYAGTERQFATFPVISTTPTVYAPTAKTVWSTQMANPISWSGVVPGANSLYAVGVLDSTGIQLWPSGGKLQSVTLQQGPSLTVPASALTAGDRMILVGILDAVAIPGAAQNSSVVVSAFSSAPLSVVAFQPNPSPSLPLSQAAGMQIDYVHSGRATVGASGPVFPSMISWGTTLNNNVSYPVIAEGKVFVLTDGSVSAGTGRSLYALDETSGKVVWGPVALSFGTTTYAAHAYDHGRVFVIDFDGLLSSYDAATGSVVWSETLVSALAVSSAPTAVNGVVYVDSGSEVFAIDESTGAFLWRAAVDGGGNTAPTVSTDGVFVTYGCQAYKFDPLSGTTLWHYNSGLCHDGRGTTSVFANNQLYDRDVIGTQLEGAKLPGRTLDAGTGTQIGTFDADRMPAFSDHAGFFMSNGTLTAMDQASGTTLWTFAGDGQLTTAPLVVDSSVVVASSSGQVYALRSDTGAVVWSATAGSQIRYSEYDGTPTVLGGIAVGDGYLVVPAGNTVTAWHLVP
jgi:outer membrane protein assembly factor BamB